MVIDNFNITKFTDNSTIDAQSFNKPLRQIQTQINSLRSSFKLLNNSSAIIQSDGFLDASVSQGDLVYFDTQDAVFKPALAQLSPIPGINGQSVQAQSCRVQGLVLAKDNHGIKILRQGYYQDPIIAATIMSKDAKPGLYYLSPSNPGKAVLDPVWHMRQPCISYYGDYKFSIMTNYVAHDSHHHATYIINPGNTGWVDKKFSIPQSVNLGYMAKDITAIFVNGVLNNDFDITNTAITYKGDLAIQQCLVVIFNYFPFAYGAGLVRSINSDSKQLTITNNNGYVNVMFNKPTQASMVYSGKAMSYITQNNQIVTTPVVSGIKAGLGIQVKNSPGGIYSIGTKDLNLTRITATDITCKGAKYVVDNLLSYVVFPKSATKTSAIAYIPINNQSKADYRINFWGLFRGLGSSITIKYYWMSQAADQIQIPTKELKTTKISIKSNVDNKLTICKDADGIVLEASLMPGTLLIQITNQASAQSVQLFKCGCGLSLVEAKQPDNSTTTTIDIHDVGKAPIQDYNNYFNDDTVQGALNQLGKQLHGVADIMSDIVGQ